ncbi:MAG: DUF2752 domain-containing protein [Planctomycetota bacterium]
MRSLLASSEQLGDRVVKATLNDRLLAGLIALGCVALLGVAAALEADPAGLNTHTRLGLPACQWVEVLGIPCPTCGMTTSFSHAADGRVDRAFLTQPMGALLAIGTAVTFWVAIFVAATGSRLGHFLLAFFNPTFLWIGAGLALVAWVYKIISFTQGWG